MSSRQNIGTKVLGKITEGDAEKLLEWLVNWPPEPEPDDTLTLSEYRRIHGSGQEAASPELRTYYAKREIDWANWRVRAGEMTKKYWPDLWRNEPQALWLLRREQRYLQEFWRTQDPHSRDWYIHRARELFYRHQLQSKIKRLRDRLNIATDPDDVRRLASEINAAMERALDQPPARTPFEDSLFYLQQKADWVRTCQNPNCRYKPYFFAIDKRRRYCSEECSWLADKKSKRESRERHPEWEVKRRSERKKAK